MQLEPNTLYAPSDVAIALRVHEGTLRHWRRCGIGPAFIRSGPRRILYQGAAIIEWLEASTTRSRAPGVQRQHCEA